eukprot:tig00000792_g4185.t1
MAPLVEWAESEYGGKLVVLKVEADNNPVSTKQCKVQGLPALVLFQDGEQVAHHEGALQKAKLKAFLESNFPALA